MPTAKENTINRVFWLNGIKKNSKSCNKASKIVLVLGIILITTSIASYFYHKKILQKKVYEV
jgi:hypothetical protein